MMDPIRGGLLTDREHGLYRLLLGRDAQIEQLEQERDELRRELADARAQNLLMLGMVRVDHAMWDSLCGGGHSVRVDAL